MITFDEVADLIRKELRGKLPAEVAITENSTMDELGLSSLQVAEIVFTMEETHGVEFDPARAADARTLGDLVALGNEALSTASS